MGEAEQQARFSRALQEAMDARHKSARQLAISMDVDPRRIAGWLKGKSLPNLYEAEVLAAKLDVKPDLFRNPPEVPPPPPKPYYPIEKYLLGPADYLVDEAVASGVQEGRRRARRASQGPVELPSSPAPRARAG